MIIVSDTTPLSELAKVGQLDLLPQLFGQVVIPQAVYTEITTGNHPAALLAPSLAWLEVRAVGDVQRIRALQQNFNLDLGESAAIALAEELNADQLLIDERAGRFVAAAQQLQIIGTVGILLLAKQRGLIESVKVVLDGLIASGMRISDRLYAQAVKLSQE